MKNKNITFVIPVLNNFKYTKYIYDNIRSYYLQDEIIITDGGSTDETIEHFKNLKDNNLNLIENGPCNSCVNINTGILAAKNEIVAFIHNDMFIPPNFKEKLLQDISKNKITSYTRIEPPIFPGNLPGKVILDFGNGIEDFKVDEFIDYCSKYNIKDTGGSQLFIAFYKQDYIELDELTYNPPQMFCADDDLHLRFNLRGFEKVVSDACVYHFVSKSTRTAPDSKQRELNSNRNFVRKWGFRQSKYSQKYNVAFVIKNCNFELLSTLEPWCDTIYTDDEMGVLETMYYEREQPNTTTDLKSKIKVTKYSTPKEDIILEFDGHQFNQNSFSIIHQLSDIITESGEIGTFELDIFKITINKIESFSKDLIFISKQKRNGPRKRKT
jgi:glycosyltransferase involved in cell wall biosynthesis